MQFLAEQFGTTPEDPDITAVFLYYPEEVDIPQRVKDRLALSEQDIDAAEEAACRHDLQCWGDEHSLRATYACQPVIEGMARYAYEWTDGWLDVKFDRFGWNDREAGIVAYFGDKIRFQNGFGAWQNATYRCFYDTLNGTVVDAEVFLR